MVKSKVNDKYDFLIEKIKDQFIINGEKKDLDIFKIDDTNYHIIHQNTSFKLSILHYNVKRKIFEIKVNTQIYKVALQDENDLLLEKIGINTRSVYKVSEVKAPMPGLIIDIKVKEGMEVKSGDPLIVLKAMKMENVIKSPSDGRINTIFVEINQKIEKNAVILQF